GFFSKDAIIEAAHLATTPGAGFAYFCVTACVFVTAFYTFRMMFMTFHGPERFRQAHHASHGHVDASTAQAAASQHEAHASGHAIEASGHHDAHAHEPHESPPVVTVPLIALAIPSIAAGWLIGPVLFGNYFGDAIFVAPEHQALAKMGEAFHGVVGMMAHALQTWPFWLSVAGIATAWYLYIKRPDLPAVIARRFSLVYRVLEKKYGFDEFNDWFFAGGTRGLARGLWRYGDVALIDNALVNGAARLVGWCAAVIRHFQSGFIYHYAFTMIIGVLLLITLLFMQS
ncbi:MAG TPA: NADH-quinone oxidoreductase subunit L, partial [Burkholderiales bacterium]|nr:NADH-quinone oxidoreductase subunit L [Burkholderiales bacterium]